MNVEIKPTCLNCKSRDRRHGIVGLKCEAYPHGIPEDVWFHSKNPDYAPCDKFEYEPLVTKYNWLRAVGIGFLILLYILGVKYEPDFPAIGPILLAVGVYEAFIYALKKERAKYVSSWRFCYLRWREEQAKIKRLSNDKSIHVHSGPTVKTHSNLVSLGTGFILGNSERAPDILLEGYWPDVSLDEKKDIISQLWQDSGAMISILKALQEKYPLSQEPSERPVAESETKYRLAYSTEERLNDFIPLMPRKLVRAIEGWIRKHPSEAEDLLDAVSSFLHTPDDVFLPYWAPLSYATKSAIWDEWLDNPDKTGDILTKLKADRYPI